MEKLIKFYCALLILNGLGGCQNSQSLDRDEFVKFFLSGNSDFTIAREIDDIEVKCTMHPPELLTLINTEREIHDMISFKKEKAKYDSVLNFVLIISDASINKNTVAKTVATVESYSALQAYANSNLKNDLRIELPSGDYIPCSVLHVEPANSIKPVVRIALSFYGIDPTVDALTLAFDDNIFNTGKLKFLYGRNILKNKPTLKI